MTAAWQQLCRLWREWRTRHAYDAAHPLVLIEEKWLHR